MNLKRPISFAAWLIAFVLAGVAGTAHAQAAAKAPSQQSTPAAGASATPPAEEPDTLILSDTLNYDDIKKESVFTGNVIMTRGLMTLQSDKLTMREDAQGFQFGTATVEPGKLVFIREENPEKFEVLEARGIRAEYDGKKEQIEMIGQAVVTRYICGKAFDNVKGERVIYHQNSGTYQAYGGANSAAAGGRVRSMARPQAKADAAAAECREKSAPRK
ncbi:lipopolysaccharide transport periplasmic protein LptA [Pollutimonas nitritireducens]|uniref:Lipopolysaccharide export system protein LptA n=1 Tax=Pollutimonas nitritireducens TaxID=2045209 RepID=A0A2N4UBP2_9BURK|nr:lipopolysaccharide transport periplasmic protein LptA [Pollutimonas nitritireducens]PLC52443.1 lipopolysaccharide transport periplasmic protein LptA [Pollutimonas nitritireducens]